MDPISPISPVSPQPTVQSNSKIWVIIAIIVVLLVAAFMLYYRGMLREDSAGQLPATTPTNTVTALRAQGTSDEIFAIEKDLNATNLSNLTGETSAIDQELSAPAAQ